MMSSYYAYTFTIIVCLWALCGFVFLIVGTVRKVQWAISRRRMWHNITTDIGDDEP